MTLSTITNEAIRSIKGCEDWSDRKCDNYRLWVKASEQRQFQKYKNKAR